MTEMTKVTWKEEIMNRIDNYNEKVSEMTTTLNKVTRELNVSPFNQKVNVVLLDEENLTWLVTIGKKSKRFYYRDFNLGTLPSGITVTNLEERVQIALIEKFTWELK
jgi:YbbR domain-containing protein